MADAERAGVIKPGSGWEKYPANMLRWRAIGFCADVVFGDVIGGLKRADELGADLTPDGDVIEGSWSDLPPAPVQPVQQGADTLSQSTQGTAPTLAELTERYDPAAIMAANDGKIPGSEDELRAVAESWRRTMPDLNHLSYSSISTYLLCGNAWRLRYLERVAAPVSVALPMGSAFHGVIEFYIKAETEPDDTQLLDIAATLWREQMERGQRYRLGR